MRTYINDRQTPQDRDNGTVTGADGRTYTRRTTRMSRQVASELVASGVPVVLDEGCLEWCDDADALNVWSLEKRYVVTSTPTGEQRSKHYAWTAGLWESEDGNEIVYLLHHC